MNTRKKLHVLFLPFWRWYPNRAHPAQGASVQEQARAVAGFHQVTVLYGEPRNDSRRWSEIDSDTEEAGVRIVRFSHRRVPLPLCTYPVYLWRLRKEFARLRREGLRPDLIHAHEYSAGVAAVILGKDYNLPVVISEHSSNFIRVTFKKRDIPKARFAMNRADVVLPVGQEVLRTLRALGIGGRIEVMPNTIDTGLFRPAPRRETGPDGIKKVLLVSLLREGKGIPRLLRAWASLRDRRRDFQLEIAGDGPKGEEYRRLAKDLGLEKAVKFLGMKTRTEVAALIQGSDFIVQPSEAETFGMTVIEAMACGKPVVATRLPAFERTISEERGVLVPAGDEEALARAIDYMLDHHHEYRKERIARYIEENFSHRAVGERLNEVYSSVLAERDR